MNHTDYYNRKGWYSILVQAVIDHDYLFRDLCVGWPGSIHDARVLANSTLFKKVTSGEVLQDEEVQIQGQTLRTYLIGDSAYPLLPWLMKPFSLSSSLNSQQKKYNYRISQRARVVVEIAFGWLKAHWCRLVKQVDMHIDNIPHIIVACCVLHNMCNSDSSWQFQQRVAQGTWFGSVWAAHINWVFNWSWWWSSSSNTYGVFQSRLI